MEAPSRSGNRSERTSKALPINSFLKHHRASWKPQPLYQPVSPILLIWLVSVPGLCLGLCPHFLHPLPAQVRLALQHCDGEAATLQASPVKSESRIKPKRCQTHPCTGKSEEVLECSMQWECVRVQHAVRMCLLSCSHTSALACRTHQHAAGNPCPLFWDAIECRVQHHRTFCLPLSNVKLHSTDTGDLSLECLLTLMDNDHLHKSSFLA